MFAFATYLFICALASRAFAFTVGANNANLSLTEILVLPDGVVKTTCNTNCTMIQNQFQACKDDPACLCNADTVAALLDCEQCMYSTVVALNLKTDFRVGSQAVLAGYASSCAKFAQVTLAANQTKLILPANWDGSFVAVLPMGAVAVVIITAVILGVSGISLVSTM